MQATEQPAVMNFDVPEEMKAATRKSDTLPARYEKHAIPGATVHYTEGPFGAYFKQEITTKGWIAGWLFWDITKFVILNPITTEPLIALYSGFEGSIPCELQGASKLQLPEKHFAFYYVPAYAFNKAEFEPGKYSALYISFANSFIDDFCEEYPSHKSLVMKQLSGEQNGEQRNLIPLSGEAYELISRMANPARTGMRKKELEGYLTLYIVEYFTRLKGRDEKPAELIAAVDFINMHYDEKLTAGSVAEHFKIKVNVLNKMFMEHEKMYMRDFITKVRREHAEALLKNTTKTLDEIASLAFFTDSPHMTRTFHREHGITPEEYRRRNRQ